MASIMNIFKSMLLIIEGWPTGFWENILNAFFSVIKDYGWTIILFTLALKIIMLPLDYFQRKASLDSAKKQAIIAPELTKLQQKYADNKDVLNQKTMELYKKANYNIIGSCLSMLVTMALTLTIFITLFTAMNNISKYKIAAQYETLESTYQIVYDGEINLGQTEEDAIIAGQTAVLAEYQNVKEGFLWIQNIWRPDTNASIILSYSDYTKVVKDTTVTEEKYNTVMSMLSDEEDGWNGYFILVVLAGVITYVSQKVMSVQSKKKSKKVLANEIQKTANNEPPAVDPSASSAKMLMVILPIMMVIFTWQYSAAFALYIIMNSFVSSFSTFGMTYIINKVDARKEQKKLTSAKAPYSR